jgi:outer membrane protein insertion porin family
VERPHLGSRVTGAGQTFNVYLQPGTVTSAYGLDFGEPRLFGTKLAFKIGGSKRIAYREDYTEDFLGYYVGLGHPLYETTDDRWAVDATLRWRHEWVSIEDVGEDAVPGVFLFEGEHELRSVALGVAARYVDDPVRPTHRMTNAIGFESVGGWVGGDLDYWKLSFSHGQNWLLREDDKGRRQTLALDVSGGVASAYDDTPEVPPFSRFFTGGRGSIRGFETRGVGPHSNGRPMGGEFFLVGSLEYQYPFVEDFLSAVAFTDWGTIGTEMWSDDSWKPRASAGIGLRLKVPMLGDAPLALDIAWPFLKEDEDDIQYLSFSLARDF